MGRKKTSIQKNCPVCKTEFTTIPSKDNKFCSNKCIGISLRNRITKNCLVCDKVFTAIPSKDNKFCSNKCRGISKITKITKTCPVCEKEFTTIPSLEGKFCSLKCSGKSKRLIITKNCMVCDKVFTTVPSQVRKLCSKKCMGIANSTEFKDLSRIKLLTEATIDGLDLSSIPISELADSSINDIFKIDIINSCDIDDDITAFALKKS